MSNLLAAVGRAQLADLERRVEARRATNMAYRRSLALPGWSFMPEAPACRSTAWLTCVQLDPSSSPVARDAVLDRLAVDDIEARPVWKPMHLQPVFQGARVIGGGVAQQLFERGLCLPSGSSLDDASRARVIEAVLDVARGSE
jgi:dTDP-4-amino-4,6-dideoxygalactose transaminase